MPFYCSHTFHGSRVLTPLLGLQGSLGSAQVSLSPTLTCISCSVTQYCPSTRGVSASQHLFKTIPFTWMPVPLLSKFYPSFLIHFPHETFSNFPDFRIPVAFSVWTMHLDTLLYIILFSNCFVYIKLSSQLYFDLRESRACLLPLCFLQKRESKYRSQTRWALAWCSVQLSSCGEKEWGWMGISGWKKRKTVWVSAVMTITQDYSSHCLLPPNTCARI